jgi:hypothetical protein
LEPGGGFYIEGRRPSRTEAEHLELVTRLNSLDVELKELRALLAKK